KAVQHANWPAPVSSVEPSDPKCGSGSKVQFLSHTPPLVRCSNGVLWCRRARLFRGPRIGWVRPPLCVFSLDYLVQGMKVPALNTRCSRSLHGSCPQKRDTNNCALSDIL